MSRIGNEIEMKFPTILVFVRKDKKKGLEHVRVEITNDLELTEARHQFKGWHEAQYTDKICPKCKEKRLLDYGIFRVIDGIIQIFRCPDDNCAYVESELKYNKEQVEFLKMMSETEKHCGHKMCKSWKYCPYCGEEL